MKRMSLIAGVSFFLGALFFALIFGTGQNLNTVEAQQIDKAPAPIKMGRFNFAPLVKRVRPAVVKVLSKTLSRGGFGFGNNLLDRYLGRRQRREVTGVGSGFLISSDGYIITNNHVVADAIKVLIKTIDDKEYIADIIGKDPSTDLALLKIDGKNLPYVELGNSKKAEVGEWVLAIGNPLNQDLTVTSGIISAKGRELSGTGGDVSLVDFIQTDAAINQGNSGGPLINMDGKVIGINSAILSKSGGSIGIGFAIPSNMAKDVIGDLKSKGSVTRGWLGVSVYYMSRKEAKEFEYAMPGFIIQRIDDDSPAEKAGLKQLDYIVSINGKRVKNRHTLRKIIATSKPGSIVTLTVLRGNKNRKLEIKVKIGKAADTLKHNPLSRQGKRSDLGMVIVNNSILLKKQYQNSTSKGVLIKKVEPNGFAAEYGLRAGDVIFGINRSEVNTVEEFSEILNELEPGRVIRLWVNRQGYETSVRVTLPD